MTLVLAAMKMPGQHVLNAKILEKNTSQLNCIVLNGISVKFIVKGCYMNITTKNMKPRIFNGPYLTARNWCRVEINLAQLITFPVFSS